MLQWLSHTNQHLQGCLGLFLMATLWLLQLLHSRKSRALFYLQSRSIPANFCFDLSWGEVYFSGSLVLFFAVCCLHTPPPEESEASHVTQRIFLRQSSCLCPLSRLKTTAFLVQISRRCWASKNLENEGNKLKAKGS